jgi:N-6 DNA Methylase
MTPEEIARQQIDAQLIASGWAVQTKDKINLSAGRGVAVCELSFATGEPDYTLFVDTKALGTVEAKPAGHSLVGVEEQSTKYVTGVPAGLPAWHNPLPFCYESTGSETRFTSRLDPDLRSRSVFAFLRPETLLAWVQQVAGGGSPLAARLREFPPLARAKLWPAQFEAIINLEKSFAAGRPRALIQMPTGIFYAQGVKANALFFDRKPAQEKPWTQKLWIYDLRTNLHFTLKENTLKRTDLDDFVTCYNPKNRHQRKASDRFKPFTYEELTKRDKVNLDIFWLKDDALEESANLPAPEIIAADITADLEAAMEQFATIAEDLKK